MQLVQGGSSDAEGEDDDMDGFQLDPSLLVGGPSQGGGAITGNVVEQDIPLDPSLGTVTTHEPYSEIPHHKSAYQVEALRVSPVGDDNTQMEHQERFAEPYLPLSESYAETTTGYQPYDNTYPSEYPIASSSSSSPSYPTVDHPDPSQIRRRNHPSNAGDVFNWPEVPSSLAPRGSSSTANSRPPVVKHKHSKPPGPKPKQKGKNALQLLNGKNGKPPREMECSFCGGTDDVNKEGMKEQMLSCDMCGRSGHPSCLSMTNNSLRKKVRTYDWHCIECKVCEICDSKGEDKYLMFCDGCDRGWHSYCLDPPLDKPPRGTWKCPICIASAPIKRAGSHASSTFSQPNSAPHSHSYIKGNGNSHGDGSNGNSSSYKANGKNINGQGSPRIIIKAQLKGKGRMTEIESESEMGDELQMQQAQYTPTIGSRKRNVRLPQSVDPIRTFPVIKLRMHAVVEETSTSRKRRKKEVVDMDVEEEDLQVERESTPLPFGGVIEGEDASTRNTTITIADKAAFEKSRLAAELKLGASAAMELDDTNYNQRSGIPSFSDVGSPSRPSLICEPPSTSHRPLRDRLLLHTSMTNVSSPLAGSSTRPGPGTMTFTSGSQIISKKIEKIRFGQFDIDTWYSAPYPEEYSKVPDGRLWICEYCLKYMKSGFVAGRHRLKCKTRHPPGDEIYREGAVSVFEVDGRKNKIYCQNLCLIAKMFLDHKTLYYDVEPFLFYVMTEVNEDGAKFVGYFSKEKRSATNNVSCIMTLPVRQRKGWGNLLIDFSYLLSKKESRTGSPEKPLSGLGAVAYRNYWKTTIFKCLETALPPVTLDQISKKTSMMPEDIFIVLQENDMITVFDSAEEMADKLNAVHENRQPTGGIARQALSRNTLPQEKTAVPSHYEIHWDRALVEAHLDKFTSKGWLKLRPNKLKYTPFLTTRVAVGKDGLLHTKRITQNVGGEANGKELDRDRDGNGEALGIAEPDTTATPLSGLLDMKSDTLVKPPIVNDTEHAKLSPLPDGTVMET